MTTPFTPTEVAQYYRIRAPRVKQTSAKQWRGPCPIHNGKRESFAVESGSGLWQCHSECGRGGSIYDLEMELSGSPFKEAARAVDGLLGRTNGHKPKESVVCEYTYTDERGRPLFRVVRFEPKNFRQKRWDGQGWQWGLADTRRVLYNLEAVAASDICLVVEGEKDTETLRSLGFVATCNPMGAGKWRPEYSRSLKGKTVIIVPDNDEPGRKHAVEVAESLLQTSEQVYVSIVPPPHKDVSDWIVATAADSAAVDKWLGQAARIESKDDIYKLWPEASPPADHEEHAATPEPPPPPPPPSDEDAPPEPEQPRPEATDGQQRESQATKLLSILNDVEYWRDDENNGYLTAPLNGHSINFRIKSKTCTDYLCARYLNATGTALRLNSMTEAKNTLESKATTWGQKHKTYIRVGECDGKTYIDLANDQWECIEISKDGWRVLPEAPIKFLRSAGMLPLPHPTTAAGGENALVEACNVRSADDLDLITGWLLGALRPNGPYPILVLQSEQGSGKSTLTQYLRGLIDPNKAPLRAQPRDENDVCIAAENSWVISYDNISHINDSMSDTLCRASTGGGIAKRALYTDKDEVLMHHQRPIILNGIEEIVTRSDLIDRSLMVQLAAIPPERRMTERSFWRRAEDTRPATLAWLLDITSAALASDGAVKLDMLPRMADFALWMAQAEPALGWEEGSFAITYARNRKEAIDLTLEASPIGRHVLAMLAGGSWSGTAVEFLRALNGRAEGRETQTRGWPLTARGASNALRRVMPTLRASGYIVEFKRDATERRIEIRKE